jgi:hypothetical protein
MSLYIQYHNNDKRGLECLLSAGDQRGIFTRRPNAKNAQGTIFLIVGLGRPRQFFLWETFEIEGVDEEDNGTYIVYGPGWQLSPPQRLEGPDFDAFKNSCANFVRFQRIDNLPYSTTLKGLGAAALLEGSGRRVPHPGRLHDKSFSEQDFFEVAFVPAGGEAFVLDADFEGGLVF